MNFLKIHFFAFLFFYSCSLVIGKQPERTVILLSFDGMGFSALNQGNAPHFLTLEKEGWHGSITPIFPSETFPNHTTMLTGCRAEEHGIISNKFIDSKRGAFAYSMDPSWIESEPLWVTLEKQKIPTAIILWPLHGHGSWNGWRPTYETQLSTIQIKKIIHFDDQKNLRKFYLSCNSHKKSNLALLLLGLLMSIVRDMRQDQDHHKSIRLLKIMMLCWQHFLKNFTNSLNQKIAISSFSPITEWLA